MKDNAAGILARACALIFNPGIYWLYAIKAADCRGFL